MEPDTNGRPRPAGEPDVSVVIPVWNVEPWLAQCVESVLTQSIGLDRLEVVAVDDGSTDRSGAMLDEYAARVAQVRVVHQAASGGPGGPRNTGLDLAGGRYVFFLDADDYLGPEALARLVAMADRNGSDIVLGRIVGVEGRKTYRDTGVFRRDRDSVPVARVAKSGNVLKLFRRSMLERSGLRFVPGLAGGEDGDFMARAYLEAGTISVVGDYDCYFTRRRPGSQTNRPDRHDDLVGVVERLGRNRFAAADDRRATGRDRVALIARHTTKLASQFRSRWAALEPVERRRAFDAGARIVRRWHSPAVSRALPAWARLRVYCLEHGLEAELADIAATTIGAAHRDPLVEDGRLFARFPHFRDASGIPDDVFDFTSEAVPAHQLHRAALAGGRLELAGNAYVRMIGGSATLVLRRWPRGRPLRVPTANPPTPALHEKRIAYPSSGFEVAADLGTLADGRPLATGLWTMSLDIVAGQVRRTTGVHVARPRLARVLPPGSREAAAALGLPGARLSVLPDGTLRLSVGRLGGMAERMERLARRVSRRWHRVRGRVLRRRAGGRERRTRDPSRRS